ncbi:hypothetical protein ACIBU0_39305 [Streptomyces sp. NPDC049627]|uniref:hypothetical protein n=1 Tax=Streptomyces sp. NPDC049627 TaxID=3365595 RepID=UPI0037A8B3E1
MEPDQSCGYGPVKANPADCFDEQDRLRHTCLTTWLDHGIPPAQVAEWAGNSVPAPARHLPPCITGRLAELQQRIEGPQRLPAGPAPSRPVPKPGSTLAPRRRA